MPYKDLQKRIEYQKKYREKNKDILSKKSKIRQKIYRLNNKDKIKKYQQVYTKKTRSHINYYCREKRKNDLEFKIRLNLRCRLYSILKNNSKKGSAVKDLGCSIEEFKKHIELKFVDGMNWGNWGRYGWHLDHIKPLSSFNLNIREELLQAVNYKNLQPMWWRENIVKGGHKSYPQFLGCSPII